MRHKKIRTGELARRLRYYGLRFSNRQLERLAQTGRLPLVLQHVDRVPGKHLRWDWNAIESEMQRVDIDVLAGLVQSKEGGDLAKIRARLIRLANMLSQLVPREDAMLTLYGLLRPRSVEERERMAALWEQKIAPLIAQQVSKRIRQGKFLS